MLIADCGTSWAKLFNTEENMLTIQPSIEIVANREILFDLATGHLSKNRTKRYENELTALAKGSLKMVNEDDFTVVDVGSRDTKFCQFKNRKLFKLDWNQSCGSSTGFTLELLGKYYNINYSELNVSDKIISVTCGVFGIEKIFDTIIKGEDPKIGIAQFVKGIAFNIYNFVNRPDKIYLSGGLCNNKCFVNSLKQFCNVELLGRDVLINGLSMVYEG